MKQLLLLVLLLCSGCKQIVWGDVPFIVMEQKELQLPEHIELCNVRPSSIFCENSESIGDVRPTKEYTLEVLREMNTNFKYKDNYVWVYNYTV